MVAGLFKPFLPSSGAYEKALGLGHPRRMVANCINFSTVERQAGS